MNLFSLVRTQLALSAEPVQTKTRHNLSNQICKNRNVDYNMYCVDELSDTTVYIDCRIIISS